MQQTWLYVLPFAMLLAYSPLGRIQPAPAMKTNHPSKKVIVMQAEDNNGVKFEVTGTVTQFRIADRSKTARVQNLYTYLTIKLEKTSPVSVASNLSVNELSFSWRTNETRDREISVGDKLILTVVGNNFTDPTWFRVYDLKKVDN